MIINGTERDISPCADLRDADLSGANLRGADLRDADLRNADLSGAYLFGANLSGASLYCANLSSADLSGADLRDAILYCADLRDASLYCANLSGANLRYAKNIPALAAAQLSILPSDGDVTGWKKALAAGSSPNVTVIVKLLIPDGTRRSNATGRKCRAERAVVLKVIGADEGRSWWDPATVYRAGETVTPREPFDDDRWNERASGIHFFITREEAEAHEF